MVDRYKIVKRPYPGYGNGYYVYDGDKLLEVWDYSKNAKQHLRDLRNMARGVIVLRPINGRKIVQ